VYKPHSPESDFAESDFAAVQSTADNSIRGHRSNYREGRIIDFRLHKRYSEFYLI